MVIRQVAYAMALRFAKGIDIDDKELARLGGKKRENCDTILERILPGEADDKGIMNEG